VAALTASSIVRKEELEHDQKLSDRCWQQFVDEDKCIHEWRFIFSVRGMMEKKPVSELSRGALVDGANKNFIWLSYTYHEYSIQKNSLLLSSGTDVSFDLKIDVSYMIYIYLHSFVIGRG